MAAGIAGATGYIGSDEGSAGVEFHALLVVHAVLRGAIGVKRERIEGSPWVEWRRGGGGPAETAEEPRQDLSVFPGLERTLVIRLHG